MAFSPDIRHEIRGRADNSSELSGETGRPLQCCHLSHDKYLQEYNTAEMGVLVTDIEHYAYHLIFKDRPGFIGLSGGNNQWSLETLWNNIIAFNDKTGIIMTSNDFKVAIQKAKDFWFYYLGIES